MVALPLFLALLAANAPQEFDIRNPDGTVIVSADQILAYDWATHTITLKPGTRKPLFKAVFGKPGNSTFVAAVGGKEVYRGNWKSVVMSSSSSAATIVVDRQAIDPKLGDDQIRIELGYPGKAFFKGDDPRNDPAVKAAVKGKQWALVLSTDTGSRELSVREAEAYKLAAAWLEERMKEAKAIKPGTSYADLAKTFKGDGGLSSITVHRYVSILCPYLKIDVEFEGDSKKPLANYAKVKKVSKPYFEREFVD